ncbi:MAG: alanine racemase [Bacteroides sp.]|nr:MAG: alanine racemase [Bacteroides sp.]
MKRDLLLYEGYYNNTILNDCNKYFSSLKKSLDFLIRISNNKKILIICDFILSDNYVCSHVKYYLFDLLNKNILHKVILFHSEIGFINHKNIINITHIFYKNHDIIHFLKLYDCDILIKALKKSNLIKINSFLGKPINKTNLIIDLNSIIKNIDLYRSKINASNVKIMIMAKSYFYGFGNIIGNILQYYNKKISYLGVACVEEGIQLRKKGINIPIVVMNSDLDSLDIIIYYKLEPVLYDFNTLNILIHYLYKNKIYNFPIHIKFNTGMNRLGFEYNDITKLLYILSKYKVFFDIKSVFSHLSSSKITKLKDFCHKQIDLFKHIISVFNKKIKNNKILFHIANTAGIVNYPYASFDMIRIGIGIYGIDLTYSLSNINFASKLNTSIIQIKNVKKNEYIGYNCNGIVDKNSKIATVNIGYGDGLFTIYGKKNGFFEIKNNKVNIIGNICMDMTMLNVTGLNCKKNDTVTIFNSFNSLKRISDISNISIYELISNISFRVSRKYIIKI